MSCVSGREESREERIVGSERGTDREREREKERGKGRSDWRWLLEESGEESKPFPSTRIGVRLSLPRG